MLTIRQALENNLSAQKPLARTTIKRLAKDRTNRQARLKRGLFSFDLDEIWQRMWEEQDEASMQLDQIY
jgi:hypothetical protein